MEGSRLRILNILQRHNRATVDQLAHHMGLASATVRRHLDILQRDRLVTFQQVKKKTGRPENSYYLTEEGQESLPKDYDRFLGRLLEELPTLTRDEVGNRSGEELLLLLFRRMAQRVAADAEQSQKESFSERVARVVTILEHEKFQPEVEQVDGSFNIHIHNCPLRSIALENRSVCTYDTILLSSLLGPNAVLEHCIMEEDGGCCHLIHPATQEV